MKYGLYVIYDKKSGYLNPMTDLNDATAMRNFQHATMNHESTMYSHGSDFELYRIGEFDSSSGIISIEDKKYLCTGKDNYVVDSVQC